MNTSVSSKSTKASRGFSLYLFFLLGLFIFSRLLAYLLYSLPINLYCGDSGFYVHLAKNLQYAAADRPSGYSFLLIPYIDNLYAVPFLQNILSLVSITILSISLKKGGLRDFWIVVIAGMLILYPHGIFMEKALMSDSVANSLLVIIASIYILRSEKALLAIIVGLVLGYLPLLRSNYIIFSLGFILLFSVKSLLNANIRNFILTTSVFVTVVIAYTTFFVYPRIHTYKINSFGGILVFSRIARYFNCNEISENSVFDKQFHDAISSTCTDEIINKPYNVMLWDQSGLIIKTENKMGVLRPVSDKKFMQLSQKLILMKPVSVFSELFISLKNIIEADNYFYRNNYVNSMTAGCELVPPLLGMTNDEFLKRSEINLYSRKVLIFASVSSVTQKLLWFFSIVLIFLTFRWFVFSIKKESFFTMILPVLSVFGMWFVYVYSSLFLAGFDYRYLQPLLILFVLQLYLMYNKD